MRLKYLILIAAASLPVGRSSAAPAPAWQSGNGCRYAEFVTVPSPRSGFTVMNSGQTGISFTNVLSDERGLTNQIYHNGSGVALGDVDGDGWCDVYLANIDGRNALYRNLGNWRFQEVAEESGVACAGIPTAGVLFADVDGDGDLDLLVNSIGRGTLVFANNGQGHFVDATLQAGTAGRTGSMSAAMADVDGDGWLDLYIANYRTSTLRDEPFTRFTVNVTNGQYVVAAVNGRPASSPELLGRFTVDERGGIIEHGEADAFFRNEGGGRFRRVPWDRGTFLDESGKPIAIPYDFGLSVMMRDLDGDGAPDIYVCNDFDSEDRLWMNRGDGTFRLILRLAVRQTSLFSMGVDVADIDRDGFDDIFVADMLSREHTRRMVQLGDRRGNPAAPGVFENRPQYMRNTLFRNRGDGTYSEIARFAGVEASEWSWTPIFMDVDLDGYEDLLISNGHMRDGQNVDYVRRIQALKKQRPMSAIEQLRLRTIFPRLDNRSVAYRNLGNLHFEDASAAWNFDTSGVKQGMALADLDNDGDLDVVANCLNNSALIYRNDSSAPRLAVRLKGKAPNTRGIGAKIRVTGGPVPQSQEMICGGRYLSGDDLVRVFAAGSVKNDLTIEVTWRNGRQSVVKNARGNRLYEVDEDAALPAKEKVKVPKRPILFRDVSSTLAHVHHEEDFDDFARQPLLMRRLSQFGPGVTWFDWDGDGFDDLFIASGRGGKLAGFRNDGRGGFEPMRNGLLSSPLARDQTMIIGLQRDRQRAVIAGSSSYEDGLGTSAMARTYNFGASNIIDELPGSDSSIGPMALADLDGDGDLELFVGGRVIPGRHPQAASSFLFRREQGQWRIDSAQSLVFKDIGLVTSAVFSDLNGDGAADLVLACEWGPLRLFHNQRGKLLPWDPSLNATDSQPRPATLSQFTGWWNSVAAGDFDGDGRMDLVAGNWGENSSFHASASQPLRVYFGDFNGDGVFDELEAAYDATLGKVVPLRDPLVVFRALPHLGSRYPGFEAYAHASVSEVIGQKADVRELAINTLQSMLFLNRGTNFEPRALPREAQLSPVFGIGVADFDGDGNDDLLLAQNDFGFDGITSRNDAGRSVLLHGNGDGTFREVPGQESGIAVYGEGRGVAVCDYDADGRVDACIGQNGTQTKLYHNESAQPGLRVRLQGTSRNPHAIGASLRPLLSNGIAGAAREIHAGSGWLSQDSPVPVCAMREGIQSIQVRWPGGKTLEVKIPPGAHAVTIDYSGTLTSEK